ncbi:polyprotein [Glycine soja]
MVAAAQMDFSTMSIGQIHQFTLEVVDQLCRQHQYFSDIMNRKIKYSIACKKPYLEIKCRETTCHCSPKKKKVLQADTKGKRRPLKFFRRRQRKGKSKGQRRFICNQTGHFAKNCPKKSQKTITLISHLQIDEYDDI